MYSDFLPNVGHFGYHCAHVPNPKYNTTLLRDLATTLLVSNAYTMAMNSA